MLLNLFNPFIFSRSFIKGFIYQEFSKIKKKKLLLFNVLQRILMMIAKKKFKSRKLKAIVLS